MHLSKRKLKAIVTALRYTLERNANDKWSYRVNFVEALDWAEEQQRRRAAGTRNYIKGTPRKWAGPNPPPRP